MALEQLAYLAAIEALENAENAVENVARQRQFIPLEPFEDLPDHQFIKIYRLDKDTATHVIDLLQPYMVAPRRISDLSIERKVLTTLRFYASGSYQADIGNHLNHAVSQASVSRCIQQVTDAFNTPNIFNDNIHLPRNVDELVRVRNKFYEKYNFPGVAGCVDFTHVAISPPVMNDNMYPEVVYVNRKGYHSINVQLICDADLKIMNIARFPGSTNDCFIWNNSNAFEYIRNVHRGGHTSFYFLGDSGYALRPWMMTPILDAVPGSPEDRFNNRHRTTRATIERCNDVLKLRFRCLLKHRTLHYEPEKSSKIINACSVLHNICIDRNVPQVDDDEILGEIDFGAYCLRNGSFSLLKARGSILRVSNSKQRTQKRPGDATHVCE
ncbi:hypothetical protein NQ315_016225 [Exocentrus adspersus]|uniref:DDE Tnp4 domain-containing protein n=1 Tax=Exocentrus adspersus TaxID=1586481 RepID=A0AAV8VIJ8_9CUCU|nr:hypothetical protein NQ315_016225 [Exocentrus adspersus]